MVSAAHTGTASRGVLTRCAAFPAPSPRLSVFGEGRVSGYSRLGPVGYRDTITAGFAAAGISRRGVQTLQDRAGPHNGKLHTCLRYDADKKVAWFSVIGMDGPVCEYCQKKDAEDEFRRRLHPDLLDAENDGLPVCM